jgi:hypothetical protein
MKKNLFRASALALLIVAMLLSSCGGDRRFIVKGSAEVDLSGAEVYGLYPLNVLPGTLVSIKGEGFGSEPGLIYLNGVGLDEFYGWDDATIWFRVPEEVEEQIEVQVGTSIAEDYLYLAPEGSITLKWVVDADGVQELSDSVYEEYGLDFAPAWSYPLYVKGQWVKSGDAFGAKSAGWDTGSRTIMWNQPESNIWISETVFTPENQDSFKPGIMLFAFEDGDNETRNLSPYESDIAFIIKNQWALADSFGDVSSDPGVRVGANSGLYDEKSNTVVLNFPVEE